MAKQAGLYLLKANIMNTRNMTVGYAYDPHDSVIPYIRLKGKWVRAAGFQRGDKIAVTIEAHERLVITKVKPEGNEPGNEPNEPNKLES